MQSMCIGASLPSQSCNLQTLRARSLSYKRVLIINVDVAFAIAAQADK